MTNQFYRIFRINDLIKDDTKGKKLESVLEQALKEAAEDETFRKVKRMSYSGGATDDVSLTYIVNTIFNFKQWNILLSIFTFIWMHIVCSVILSFHYAEIKLHSLLWTLNITCIHEYNRNWIINRWL